jgi:hypothetical protein
MSWGLIAHSSKIKGSIPQYQFPAKNKELTAKKPDAADHYPKSTGDYQVNLCTICPANPGERRQKAFQLRVEAALFQKNLPLSGHQANNDELIYPTRIGNYTKALPHNQLGQVNACAYQEYLEALISGTSESLDAIPLGGTAKLANPQAAYAFEMVGPDSHHLSIPAAPPFNSAWLAGEMVELYWQALTRDVPFQQYTVNPQIQDAATELSALSDFRGLKVDGAVTPETLFRYDLPGALDGPYLSQFLYQNIPFGSTTITQRYNAPVPMQAFLTDYAEWLNVQNGKLPSGKIIYTNTPVFLRNGRDLSEYVNRDFSFQATLGACLILLSLGQNALALSNPYLSSPTQTGFSVFGAPHILDFVARASRAALIAAWFQKWLVHRRLRPEEFGGAIHNKLIGAADYPISDEVLTSKALCQIFGKYGSYLLPQGFPEGSPTHPAYPSGHAAFIGAGVTMLKAFFKESFVLPEPVMASPDGLSLLPYHDGELTIGGELNKLAANITIGRNFAGNHWRSDNTAGMELGEAVAIGILQDYRNTYNEDCAGFSFTKFDGNTITI